MKRIPRYSFWVYASIILPKGHCYDKAGREPWQIPLQAREMAEGDKHARKTELKFY